MQRINVFLTASQIGALKKLAKHTGLSYAELIRRAIDLYLALYLAKAKAK